jgi:fibronectin type 3 domain-containing protein
MKRLRLGVLLGLLTLLTVGLMECRKETQPHSVTLNWQGPRPEPTVAVVGYNLYRSTTAGTQYVRIATRVSGPPYEDRLVNSGRTYFYVVTAVDQSGRESRFSAEVQAQIP